MMHKYSTNLGGEVNRLSQTAIFLDFSGYFWFTILQDLGRKRWERAYPQLWLTKGKLERNGRESESIFGLALTFSPG